MNIKNFKGPYNILHYLKKSQIIVKKYCSVTDRKQICVCVLVYSANSIFGLQELCIMQHINYTYNIL
jgi:hypothetical protein